MSTSLEPYIFQEELYNFSPSILVVISKPWDKLSDDDKGLLTKILSSVRVRTEAVTIRHETRFELSDVRQSKAAKVIVFGSALLTGARLYESTTADGISLIKADDLSELDDSRKKSLWVALKQMFAV